MVTFQARGIFDRDKNCVHFFVNFFVRQLLLSTEKLDLTLHFSSLREPTKKAVKKEVIFAEHVACILTHFSTRGKGV